MMPDFELCFESIAIKLTWGWHKTGMQTDGMYENVGKKPNHSQMELDIQMQQTEIRSLSFLP